MSSQHLERPVKILIESRLQYRSSVASFSWEDSGRSDETRTNSYTIGIGHFASLELDIYVPALVRSAALHEGYKRKDVRRLGAYIGERTVGALCETDREFDFIDSTLSFDNRQNLVALQFAHPSTPLELREACGAMIDAQRSLDKMVS